MRGIVVWDADDVVAEFVDHFCATLQTNYGQTVNRSYITAMTLSEFVPVPEGVSDRDHFVDYMVKNRLIEDCQPTEGAATQLRLAREYGYENIMVTARDWHPNGEGVTLEWLEQHGMGDLVTAVYITDPMGSKVEALEFIRDRHGDIDLFIEDSQRNAREAMLHGAVSRVALVTKPWNEEEILLNTGIIRVADIAEAVSLLDTHGHGHHWRPFDGAHQDSSMHVCSRCGLVRRRDRTSNPCKPARVGLRSGATSAQGIGLTTETTK